MASNPGILTDWPWTWLGNYKYIVMAPFAVRSTYAFITKEAHERDLSNFLILPMMLWRVVHNLLWISFSRYKTAKGSNRIVDKNIDFEQVDREANWDDQILFNGLLLYVGQHYMRRSHNLPFWNAGGVIWTFVLHAGPVEFLYYWLHRALHHHFLYSRYHSHHHSSVVTEPITSVIHPFAEHLAYYALFASPLVSTVYMGNISISSIALYITYIDLMNNMGHCNFEHIPKEFFSIFPPLKYLLYTPSFHSLHHTQFRTNYSLFMPLYDYIYGTTDKSSDSLYEKSLVREEDSADVVHLTHLTTPESIYHLHIGLAHLASQPYRSKWYLLLMWPLTLWTMIFTWLYGRRPFVVERNLFKHLKLQTWVVPKYTIQYHMNWQAEAINGMIEDAVLSAEEKGVRILSLGLLNQASLGFTLTHNNLNGNGEAFLRRHPHLKLKVVDGSSLAVAIVLNAVHKDTTQVLLCGNLTKVAYAIASALCNKGIKVLALNEAQYKMLKAKIDDGGKNLALLAKDAPKIWLVGDGITEAEQAMAPKGSIFIPFSQFPPKKVRKDCTYHVTPSMVVPKYLQNLDSCENWLPRRVMSAWRIAGILHGAEGWNVNECGELVFDVNRIWEASLKHGFRPL
ncbi:hypothetical protein M569_14337, partial [Genlisea aurea]